MPVCEGCQYNNPPDRDFCADCGGYLRWEPTGPYALVTAPVPIAKRRSENGRHGAHRGPQVGVSLGVPGEPVGAEADVVATVEGGGRTSIVALVRNRGDLVDRYVINVTGIDRTWWTAEPELVPLNPFGAPGGDYERLVTIHLHPPRAPEALAGDRQIAVVARPQGTSAAPAAAHATLRILPFHDLRAKLTPEVASGRRVGRFALELANCGNAPVQPLVTATEEAGRSRIAVEHPGTPLPPGGGRSIRIAIRPPKQIWIGRARDSAVTVEAASAEGGAAGTCRGTFRQRPWLPWWVPVVFAPLAAIALAMLALWPRSVAVPDLTGVPGPFEAQTQLQEAGLELDAEPEMVRRKGVRPGSVIAQTPAPGTKVEHGTEITIRVARGSGRHEVPEVLGMTLAEADAALGERFVLGRWAPEDADPNAVIRAQWPAAGEKRRTGTPINVSLERGVEPGRAVPVPASGGEKGEKADAQAPDEKKGQGDDEEDAPTSAAMPDRDLAYDDGADLFLTPTGGRPGQLSVDGKATEPAWSPDGRRLSYMRTVDGRGRIFVMKPALGDYPGRPRSDADGDYRRPTWSPDGTAIAFTDSTTGSLCIAAPQASAPPATCHADRRWAFEHPAWTPAGDLLVVAHDRTRAAADGLAVLRLPPGVPPAEAWADGPVRPSLQARIRNVQYVAVAPDGKRVAATVGPRGAAGQVISLPFSHRRLGAAPTSFEDVTACTVTWTPDGKLTVTQPPCHLGGGQIEVVNDDGSRREVGTGASPAWRPEVER